MIGIKIHQLSIQTSVIGRHLGLPLQGDLDGYSKVCDILGGGGGADNWHIIHHKFSIHIQANVISHRLGYVTIFFFFGGGGCWIIGINIQQLPIQTNVMGVD